MKTLQERFDGKWTPEPMSGCWLWTASIGSHGYGHISAGMPRGAPLLAHRVSWMLHRGDPGEMFVCHKCDNKQCVNPDHLFIGTHTDNMRDMMSKDRGYCRPGGRHPRAILDDSQVLEIRRLHAEEKWRQVDIADKFGVTSSLIHLIIKRQNWTHL